MSPPLNHFLLLLFLSFFFKTSYANNSTCSTLCPTKFCTPSSVPIHYPFSLVNSFLDYYCGYSWFRLNCSNGQPVITLPNHDQFYVRDIDYDNQTITLVDTDVVNQTCPRVQYNFSLGDLPLNYSDGSDSFLSFYFNCSSTFSDVSSSSIISCLESGSDHSYVESGSNHSYVFLGNRSDEVDWYGKCETSVVVAVKTSEFVSNDNGSSLVSDFGKALNQGLVLDWSSDQACRLCEASNGCCGSNTSTGQFLCFCPDGSVQNRTCGGLSIGVTSFIFCIIIWCCNKRSRILMGSYVNEKDLQAFVSKHGPLALKRYTFKDIKKMTSSFQDKLGEGGYGSVYKGKLFDGRDTAVKVLKVKGSGEAFVNEVASIGRTFHVNIVTLLGYCYEAHKRVLIYEFMPNGSLEKFIKGRNASNLHQQLEWEKLYKIAIEVARGLEYLHRGCNTRILHFDIKPHNILLGIDFQSKISDFGLAKLCNRKESIISLSEPRGTIGYIAPEVFSRNFGGVSSKSDVYSYGMMVLDMVGGREKDYVQVDDASESTYFPQWIYKRLEMRKFECLGSITSEDLQVVQKLSIVGLWCIQMIPSNRPSISRVIEMLEGNIEALDIPPSPFHASPPILPVPSSSASSG